MVEVLADGAMDFVRGCILKSLEIRRKRKSLLYPGPKFKWRIQPGRCILNLYETIHFEIVVSKEPSIKDIRRKSGFLAPPPQPVRV